MSESSTPDGGNYFIGNISPYDMIQYNSTNSQLNSTKTYEADLNSDFLATVLTFILGCVGNILALLVLFKSPRDQHKSVFYILVACLVSTDLFGLVTQSLLVIAVHVQIVTLITHQLCQLFSFIVVFARLTTLLVIGSMAVDRYLSLHSAYVYSRYVDHTHALKLVIAILVLATLFASAPLLRFSQYTLQYPGTWCYFCRYGENEVDMVYASLFSSLGLLVILLLVVCNVSAIWTLLKAHFRHRRDSFQGKRRTSSNEDGIVQRKEEHREIQMAVLLAGIAVSFTTCWGPILVRTIYTTVHKTETCTSADYTTPTPDRRTDMYLIHLASFNQILDPWVYILLRKECLQRGMRFVRWLICRKRVQNQTMPQQQTHQIVPMQQYCPRRQSSHEYWRRARSCSALSDDMRGRRKSRLSTSDRHHSTVTSDYTGNRRGSNVFLCPCCRFFPMPQYVLGKRKPSNFSYFSTARPSTVVGDGDTDSIMTASVFQVNGRRMTVDQQSAILVAISEKQGNQSEDCISEVEEEGVVE